MPDPYPDSPHPDDLLEATENLAPPENEDQALALLKKPQAPAAALEALAKNNDLMKSRKVRLRLAMHPRTPRHISVPLLRNLFTLELMRVALHTLTPADVKRAAENVITGHIKTISSGERATLARRASGRVAGALLLDAEPRIVAIALDNGRLTESEVVKALMRLDVPSTSVAAICRHPKWLTRHEVQIAALQNSKTPLGAALGFARALHPAQLKELLAGSRVPPTVADYLRKEMGLAQDPE